MYTWYSVAAVFAVLAGGILIDRMGTRKASLLFSVLVTAGAAIVAWAPSVNWMYFGRLVFGIGSEPLVVAQSAILARWFRGKELALAFGVALTVSRLGTLFTFNTEALVASRYGWRQALWLAAALCAASVVANLLYNALDKKAERPLGLKEEAAGDRIEWAKIGGFSKSFWYVTLLCVTFYSAIFPSPRSPPTSSARSGISPPRARGARLLPGRLLQPDHMFSTAQGTTSIVITRSMFFAPFAGRWSTASGGARPLMIVGSLLMIPAHLALGYTMLTPVAPMIVLGRRVRPRPRRDVALGPARRGQGAAWGRRSG
jgi:nitrate/nitrite transporter NarK